jgi:hypothetical protein
MGRFKATAEGNVPFTPEEEAEWDAMEAEWEANEPQRRREAMTVTNKQLRLALNDAGVYGDVDAAMAKSTNTTELEIYWNYSATINRLDPWIVAVAEGMGLTDEQVDSIFDEASTYG